MSLIKENGPVSISTRYDDDVFAWSLEQAALLKQGHLSAADLPNIIEEIKSLGNEQLHALESHYTLLIFHLLKWQYQPERRSRSWATTIINARNQIRRREKRNPTLRARAKEIVDDIYPDSMKEATTETGISSDRFPDLCPYTLEQLRDLDYFPE